MAQPISNIASGISIDKAGNIAKNNSSVVNGIMSIFPKTANIKAPAGPALNQNVVSPALRSSGVSSVVQPQAPTQQISQSPLGVSAQAPTPSPYQVQGGAVQPVIGSTQASPVKGVLPTPTYGGLVTSLANASAPTTQQQGLVRNIQNTAAGNQGLIDQAKSIGDLYGGKIAEVGRLGAGAVAGDLSTGTNVVGSGNAAIASQSASSRMQALANDEQQQLGALDRQLAGQNQMAGQFGTALSGANTLQSQQMSGLNNAASLAQPSPAGVGQTVFNPLTGQYDNNATGGLSPEVMQQYAQMAATGQYAAIPSFITSNPVLNAQLNVGAKAIDPNYTPIGAQGASGVLQGIPAMQSANTAAEGIKNSIQSFIQQNPTINPNSLNKANFVQAWLNGDQLSDPKYQIFSNYLDEYTNTLAPILGVGGNPTNLKTQIAQGFINAAASGQSISQVLDAMSELANHKIQDLQNGALGGSTSVPSAGGAGGFADSW